MAGEVVLAALLQAMLEKIFAAASRELSQVSGVGGELSKLASVLHSIRSVIDDAECRQSSSPAVRHWLLRLRSLSHAAEDALDLHNSLPPHRRFAFLSRLLRLPLYRRTALRVRSIRRDLEELSREREILGLNAQGGSAAITEADRPIISGRPPTSSLVDDSGVFGRSEDLEELLRLLLLDSGGVSFVSVVGMGGMGKTTLAQVLYNDRRTRERFQVRAWVCVSEDLDVGRVTKEIAEAVTAADCGDATGNAAATSYYTYTTFTNLNLVQENVAVRLNGKRFLVVLDDAWSEDRSKWQTVLSPLMCGGSGSKVLVTSRSVRVAKAVGSRHTYRLGGLGEEDCWRLFRSWAFPDGDSSRHPKLEEIGREIAKKLKGFPLAAKTLGSLLYSKFDEDEWYNVLRSEIWELPQDKNSILPALRLSYQHLPPHLKRCFVYCSVFHKDYVFVKEDLIRIWMALGYVQPSGRQRLEDVAGEYFDDLLYMSFFQHHGKNYVMHDMVHELAQWISAEECFRMEDGSRCNSEELVRHLSVSCADTVPTRFNDLFGFKGLRTLMLLRGYKSPIAKVPHDLFLRMRCLRVLVLRQRDIRSLPGSIGNLKQLRYLNLSGSSIQSLPSSICALYNLQTLKLKNCVVLDLLPRDMSRLVSLRHLEATPVLISTISGIGKLTCLQALEEYFILDRKGHRIAELKGLAELRGKLCIRNLENVKDSADARNACVGEKPYISVLELLWSENVESCSWNCSLSEEILESLRPHQNLKELKISYYGGRRFPDWSCSEAFSSLRVVSLSHCGQCESLPSLGQLPFLECLLIEGMDGVRQISSEFYGEGEIKGFPSLKELAIVEMPHLMEWHDQPEGIPFPVLHELLIEDCSQLRSLPLLPHKLMSLRITETGIISLPGTGRCLMGMQGSHDPSSSAPVVSSPPPCLSSLHISKCPNLTSLAEGLLMQELVSLEDLTIGNCENLLVLPLRGFQDCVSLKKLHINHCEKLDFRAKDKILPPSLHDLRIGYNLSLGKHTQLLSELKNLNSLKQVEFADCPYLHSFPEEMPANLEVLRVSNCAGLRSLPAELRRLSSLRSLIIIDCPQIDYLPLGGLPDLLQDLCISNCPSLKSRYQEGGRDWHAIAHVPNLNFDREKLLYRVKMKR